MSLFSVAFHLFTFLQSFVAFLFIIAILDTFA